jgi:hemerythrin
MLENTNTRKKRRSTILEGISQDLKQSDISKQLGTNRWVIMSDIRNMKKNGDVGLKQAEEAQAEIREKKVTLLKKEMNHFKQNERFLNSTGITLQEKSFRNMVDYNKFELLKILKSDDQHAEIIKLPKSIQRTLKKNGVITKRWRDNEITERAEDYLTIKNPSLEL